MAVTVQDLTAKGFTVEPAVNVDSEDLPTVYYVCGHNLCTYVAEDDLDSVAALASSRPQELAQEPVTTLRSLAADLEVGGRSAMTKDQLIEAVYTAEQARDITETPTSQPEE